MVILVNKKRAAWILVTLVVLISLVFLYRPYLRKYEYPLYMAEKVVYSAQKHGVDPYLVWSVMKSESKFDEWAISVKGAQGLMQLTPETADWAMKEMGIEGDAYEPEINIEVGCWYLAKLIEDHDGSLTAALAAYNAGSTNVNRWKNEEGSLEAEDIEFEETRNYVYKTLEYYENYKKLYHKGE